MLLLEHGADWRHVRSLNGRGFPAMLEESIALYGEQSGLAEVRLYLEQARSIAR